MSEENVLPEPQKTTAPQRSDAETVPQKAGTISRLSEADRSLVDELVQAMSGTISPPLQSALSFLSVVDSSGNPIEAVGAREIGEGLIGQSREPFIAIPASEFEKLSAKTAEILREAELAYQRISKDHEETESLKTETRALLARLRAA